MRFSCFLRLAGVIAIACALSGCADLGDSFASTAFVSPSKYQLYDCKKLEAERTALSARTIELQKLLDKAATGTAGTMVGELAYRNDYISVRAQLKSVNENWQANRCDAPAAAPAATEAAAPRAPAAGQGSARAIY